jgi:hypothetical protein
VRRRRLLVPEGSSRRHLHISQQLHTYYVPWNTGRTEIRVVQGTHGPYLRTDRDGTSRNNLDDLPDC